MPQGEMERTMRKAPLYEALQKYCKKDIYPFHMPGHKQGRGLVLPHLLQMDLTELEGLDNLHHSTEVIREAQVLAAKTFGSEETYFLVNGSTAGIMAAILTVCNPGDVLITARNCHRAVYNGMIMSGSEPVYILPEMIQPYGLVGGITPATVKKALDQYPMAKAVIITSPTYEGFTSHIEEIVTIAHERNCIVIVDEAHGAHFRFSEEFPKSALEAGADLVIQSIHKTLPSLTQSAMLHVQGDKVCRDRLQQMLSMVQTTSPSYLLMAGLDVCRAMLDECGEEMFAQYVKKLSRFRGDLENTQVCKLLGRELVKQYGIYEVDISKLVLYIHSTVSGVSIDRMLRQQYGIQMEMSSFHHLIGITSVADEEQGFERLRRAIKELDKSLPVYKSQKPFQTYNMPMPTCKVTPREAQFSSKKSIKLSQSEKQTVGEFVIPYPPGIPLLCPGEEITREIIVEIQAYKSAGIKVVGMKDPIGETIQVLERLYA